MEETAVERRGVSERLLKELLKSPRVKNDLKLLAASIDPEAAGGLVRTLVWDDVEVFMGTVSVLPALVNYAARAARELLVQLNGFPPPMLVAFLSQLAGQVDFTALEGTLAEFNGLLERVRPVLDELRDASEGVREQAGALAGKAAPGASAAAEKPAVKKTAAERKPAAAKKPAAKRPGAAE